MINSSKKFGIPDRRALRFDCTDFIFDKRIGVGGVGSFKNNFEFHKIYRLNFEKRMT